MREFEGAGKYVKVGKDQDSETAVIKVPCRYEREFQCWCTIGSDPFLVPFLVSMLFADDICCMQ